MQSVLAGSLWDSVKVATTITSSTLALQRGIESPDWYLAPVDPTQTVLVDGPPVPWGSPWGNLTAANCNLKDFNSIPDTGITRYYDFDIDRGLIAPDGVNRSVILINGEFPGPAIEANWGDWIEVNVHNRLTNEGTSMHWHGLLQKATPWMDGVPSVGQCPIAPGNSLTYRFRAELFGSTWYHAHYSAQYNAGLFGPLTIYGPSSADYDIDLGPVLLFDWYHAPYYQLVAQAVGNEFGMMPPVSDNNLINGLNQETKFHFEAGKTHRLRLMNTGSDGVQKFTIDNHKMTIIAQDFVATQPLEVDTVTLAVGQRTDVLVKADLPAGSAVWMRSNIVEGRSCGGSHHGTAKAMIYYNGANEALLPETVFDGRDQSACWNDPVDTLTPAFPLAPAEPDLIQQLTIGEGLNATGHIVWTLNGQTYRANYNYPILELASQGNTSYPYDPEWNVLNLGDAKSIRFVINNPTPSVHPWHVHGHDAYILAEGPMPWDGKIPRPQNPIRRDTHIIRPFGYLVLQIDNDNPGVWPFHCHIAWHLSEGLAMNLMMQPEKIQDISSWTSQTCENWDAFTNSWTVTEIDAGA